MLNISNAHFLGKESLFKPPFRKMFVKMGGIPVKRDTSNNMVKQVVDLFNQTDNLVIALSPEGTRKKTERLRTGFYHIASEAKVPIVMAAMDYNEKKLTVSNPFFTTEDEIKDFRFIIDFFSKAEGKFPKNGFAHLKKSPF
ncbi:MAG: 1-acyl-sn-glycerol-3-phosphate acyltransferase [Chitinophagaceae bacterium]|nr:1-acyl-sn-glycerol-3-phosphate acyltransferase [Chitinophagaceae bacterium]